MPDGSKRANRPPRTDKPPVRKARKSNKRNNGMPMPYEESRNRKRVHSNAN